MEINPYADIVIPTCTVYVRNLISVNSGDALVAIAGDSGILSEISMARQYQKPIIAVKFV